MTARAKGRAEGTDWDEALVRALRALLDARARAERDQPERSPVASSSS